MRYNLSLLMMAMLIVHPTPAHAWWEEGHQVVARIAAKHLTPAALRQVSQLLEVENTPEAVADALAKASTWADEVKADSGTGTWHFIDLTLQDNRSKITDRCANDDCIVARIRLFAAQIKANDPDADTRFGDDDALRFLVHFVADLHQPLHAVSDADQGGNCEVLDNTVEQAKNLHALWDGPLVSRMGTDDMALATALNAEIAEMDEGQRGEYSGGDAEDWAWESHRLAMVNIYKRLAIPKEAVEFPETCAAAPEEIQQLRLEISEKYLEEMQPIVREQLKKAGLRLARLLNGILG